VERDRERRRQVDPRSVLWASVPLGIGLIGAIDTIIFHQLLQWHNFYVDTTEFWRIFSDGVLHTFTTSMLFFGAWRLWQERRSFAEVIGSRPFWAGVLLGGGGFQLFDGVVNHKILQLHPVREGAENILVYDALWIGSALVMLAAGWAIYRAIAPVRSESAGTAGGPRGRAGA
jgi:uncharacterized membrane protein